MLVRIMTPSFPSIRVQEAQLIPQGGKVKKRILNANKTEEKVKKQMETGVSDSKCDKAFKGFLNERMGVCLTGCKLLHSHTHVYYG